MAEGSWEQKSALETLRGFVSLPSATFPLQILQEGLKGNLTLSFAMDSNQ